MSEQRLRRVNELLQREISLYIEKYISADTTSLITINRVKVSPDLHYADVFVSVMGGTDDDCMAAFNLVRKAKNKIQKQINKNMKIKFTPKLDFRYDDSIAEGARIVKLLDELGY